MKLSEIEKARGKVSERAEIEKVLNTRWRKTEISSYREGLQVQGWPAGIPATSEEFYAQYGRLIAMWLLRHNKRPVDAEDILQEFWAKFMASRVLEKFVQKLGPGSDDPSDNQKALIGYLKNTVHNFFVNWCRDQTRHVLGEKTRAPLKDGSSWESTLVEEQPEVEFEDRFDLVRTLEMVRAVDDGASVERALTVLGNEIQQGSTFREAVVEVRRQQRLRQRVLARQG